MTRAKQSKGVCVYCGQEFAKSAMTKHLPVCAKRQEAIEQAASKKGVEETLYHLRVQAAYQKEFWLDVEMRGKATLKDLDTYLRAIWLECCGHMSEFYYGKAYGREIGMSRKADDVFGPDVTLTHIYDFGTSSETLIQYVASRKGQPTTAKPIALMARNAMPEAVCIECGAKADYLCMECLIEDEEWGTLCEEHAEDHPHDNYGEPVPLVNSPRLGMCGYDGPADPPY